MKCLFVILRIVLFTVAIYSIARRILNLSVIPCLENNKIGFGITSAFFVAISLLMLEWSWIALMIMDSGSLERQIPIRGTYAIERFQKCPKCGLQKPPRCHHCSKCGKCILYMDHHCKALGICLAYRNFKTYILVLFYGAAALGLGCLILFVSLFMSLNVSKLEQIVLAIFCGLGAAGLIAFAKVYLNLKKHNLTTIEAKFHMESPVPLASADVFEKGLIRFLPLPSQFDPFEPFLRDLL